MSARYWTSCIDHLRNPVGGNPGKRNAQAGHRREMAPANLRLRNGAGRAAQSADASKTGQIPTLAACNIRLQLR
jgi:hypothetical protein